MLAAAFFVYERSETWIDSAYKSRERSFSLLSELRETSHALTQMSRSYVATGNQKYRREFNRVLTIREGRAARPSDGQEHYWIYPPSSPSTKPPVSLLSLIAQANFTPEERQWLVISLQAADELAEIGRTAMTARDRVEGLGEAERQSAVMTLYDERYQAIKLDLTQALYNVRRSIEVRAIAELNHANQVVIALRVAVVFFGVLLLIALVHEHHSLKRILGGSVGLLYKHIDRLGRGDFSEPITIENNARESILGRLLKAQANLAAITEQSRLDRIQAGEADSRFRDIVDTADGIFWEADPKTFQFTFVSQKAERLLGYSIAEWLRPGFWEDHLHPDDKTWAVDYCIASTSNGLSHDYEYRFLAKDGRTVWLREIGTVAVEEGEPRWLRGLMVDVTAKKLADQELSIAAVAFESQDGVMVTDQFKTILRVNKAFSAITGFSADEAIGQKPSMLNSGRQSAEFYAEMWRSINDTGAWMGEVWNRRKNGEIYPQFMSLSAVKNARGETTHYVASFSDITQRKEALDEIHRLAYYDALTDLPNRRLLLDRLTHALAANRRNRKEGALLFIDLDNFKHINDSWGHEFGDQLLRQVARRLEALVRQGDTVARLGGDEFVIMIDGLGGDPLEAAGHVKLLAEKILADLSSVFHFSGRSYQGSASIGVALFNSANTTVDALLKEADISMYAAKTAGRNTVRFFDPEMQAAITQRTEMLAELNKALIENQFVLHYQVQCDASGCVIGVEGLLRWQSPERGLVSPGEFVPLIEDNGLILPVGRWVIATACAQLARWASDPVTAQLSLAVNVSAKQFDSSGFVDEIRMLLASHPMVNPANLKLELTESLLLNNVEESIAKMLALKAMGLTFSMDDFGTGYSSLSYLRRLPLDQLKIDRSFVDAVIIDEHGAVITLAIIGLAQSLGLQVIAEGVETEEQLAFLRQSGCQFYQGYLFSKPLPLDKLEPYLAKSRSCQMSH